MKKTLAILLAALMVMSVLPAFALSSTAAKAYPYTATDPFGGDVTEYMTDGDISDYIDRHQWYGYIEEMTWTVENGRLYIAGTGDVTTEDGTASSYPWYKLRNEITEVVVFPNTVESIGKNAFASLTELTYVEIGEGVNSIGEKAFACGADGLTVALPSSVTVADTAFSGCTNVTTYTMEPEELTIAPVDLGFANNDGATELSFTLKKGSTPFAVPEGYSWRLQITDGTRWRREYAGDASTAMKLIAQAPSGSNTAEGLYTYEVCNLPGEDQFIPQYECSYVITVQLYDENGEIAYTASSDYHEFKMDEWAIYEERTSAVVLNGHTQALDLDLGKAQPIGAIQVACCQANRVYKWIAYGSNDKDLPLSKWTFLGEKQDDSTSDGYYTAEVDPGTDGYEAFRYVKIIGTYNSANWGFHFAEVVVTAAPPAYLEVPFTATDFYGDDWTAELTDDVYADYMGAFGEHTWYDIPDGYAEDIDPAYVWTVEQGRLYIGGIGAVTTEEKTASSYPWAKLSDEITEIIVFPGTVSSIDDNAFATLENVKYIEVGAGVKTIGNGVFASGADGVIVSVPNTISSIGKGVLNGCTDITIVINNASVMDFLTYVSIGADNEELDTAAFVENTTTKLTIAPVGDGFANNGGKTQLSFTLKNGSSAFAAPDGYSWKLLIYDGKRYSREPDDFICSAIKIISVDPTSVNGNTYTYDVCELEGENQFVPQYESSYIIVAQLYDEDGNVAYSATSGLVDFTMDVEAIYGERTSAVTTNSRHGYVLLDLGKELPVGKLNVGFCQASRYYHWVAYGSNDPTLPLSMWTFLGEKKDSTTSTGSYAVEVEPGDEGYGSFRYVRIECTYNSANWGAHFAEVDVYAIANLFDVTFVVDGVSTVVPTMQGTAPVVEDPVKDPVIGENFETTYIFLGWSDGTTLYKPGEELPKITGSITYTAVFEEFTERPFLMGDVDGSGFVDISDVTQLLKYLAADEAGKQALIVNEAIATYALDVDTNMAIDISDVTELLKVLAGE